MGVISCSRSGCDSIMCDTHIDSVGNICYDCQSEFIKCMESHQIWAVGDEAITYQLKRFMKINKDYSSGSGPSQDGIREFFNRHTK